MEQGIVVRGIAYDKNVARISIHGSARTSPGSWLRYSPRWPKPGIDVDIIVQSGDFQNGKRTSPLRSISRMRSARCR